METLKPLSGSSVLVTGGAGFIGSNLVDALMGRGAKVLVLDNLSSGSLENIAKWFEHPDFEFVRGDLLNRADVAEGNKMISAVIAPIILEKCFNRVKLFFSK